VRNVCLLAVKCYSDNVGETFATAMRQTLTVALVQRLRVNLIIVVKLVHRILSTLMIVMMSIGGYGIRVVLSLFFKDPPEE